MKILSATFGIGGGNCPHCPPLATRLLHYLQRCLRSRVTCDKTP